MKVARQQLDERTDATQLGRPAETCVSCEEWHTALVAFALLASDAHERHDLDVAKVALARAEQQYDRAGSMTGGPEMLRRRAELVIADGAWDEATGCVERGLRHLSQHPHGGMNVARAAQRLEALRCKIAEIGSATRW